MESKTYQFNCNVFVVIKVFSYNTADNKLKPIYIFFYTVLHSKQCQMQAGEEDHTWPGWTTSRCGQDSLWKSQSE